MAKKGKKKSIKQDNHLNLNKLPIPDEVIRTIMTFLPKKWAVPRIPKKMNSQLYSLRSLYVNNDKCLFDVNTHVKIKKSIYKKFQNDSNILDEQTSKIKNTTKYICFFKPLCTTKKKINIQKNDL